MKRAWVRLRSLALPVGAYWGVLALAVLLFSLSIAFTEHISGEDWIILFSFGASAFAGVAAGQLTALARVRSWVIVSTAVTLGLVSLVFFGYVTTLGVPESVVTFVGIFWFLFPWFLLAGLWSLRVHMGLLATWGPAVFVTGSLIAITEDSGSVAAWHAGDKWAIWDVVTAPILLGTVLLLLVYLVSRELHRLNLWRYGPKGPDLPRTERQAGVRKARIFPGCGALVAMGALGVVLTVAAALVAPYLWRTGPGDRDGDTDDNPAEWQGDPNDSDGDGIPNQQEDRDGDGDPRNDDTDGDGIPDYQDGDDDGDGIPSSQEGGGAGGAQKDTDGDGIPDFQDADDDGDGVPTEVEAPWGSQQDTNGDGTPDHLDGDDDGDGTPTEQEDPNHNGDPQDDDSDGDGTPDYLDGPPPPPQRGCNKEEQPPPPAEQPPEPSTPQEQVVEAVKNTGISLIFLILMVGLTVAGLFVFLPPLRRTLLIHHLRRPLWPVPPTRQVQLNWRLVEVVLRDAGVHRRPGDTASTLAQRAAAQLQASGVDPEPILAAAEIADRVVYGYGLNPDDTDKALRLSQMAYEAVWETLTERQKLFAVYRIWA